MKWYEGIIEKIQKNYNLQNKGRQLVDDIKWNKIKLVK